MFEKVLDCPKCRKRFHYECDGAIPPRIVCPECHAESPMEEYSAVVLCSECRAKLKLPLDMLDNPSVVCPKCGMTLVGASLNLYDEGASTISMEGPLSSGGEQRLLADGELFDKYRIVRLLGRGGMAEVYLAEHLLLRRPCALKLMRRGLADDGVFIKRFIREAKLANRINHPNIVRVYDAGSDFKTGLLFLAMEYVEGKTLLEMIHEKIPTEAELREILAAMSGALKALAELHVIHRDIKPSNIMRTKEGIYKLMDLGIAKSEHDPWQGEMTLTVGQASIGTPAYASPEQCRSAHDVDIRSDIYCLGATLYHLASGKVPFDGETPVAIILKVLQSEAEPLRKLRPDLSPQFVDLIGRMMAKNPDDRPSSPDELLALATEPVRRRLFTFRRIVVAAEVLVLVALVLVLVLSRSGKKPPAAARPARTAAARAQEQTPRHAPSIAAPATLEERLRHVEKRLGELRAAPAGNTESEVQRKFREYRIRIREEQLKRLQAQQKVRTEVLDRRKQGYYTATEEFLRDFALFVNPKNPAGWSSSQIRSAHDDLKRKLIAALQSDRLDPNVEVVDPRKKSNSGTLLHWLLETHYSLFSWREKQQETKILEQLVQRGGYMPELCQNGRFYDWKDTRQCLLRGGLDRISGILLQLCRGRLPLSSDDESLITEFLYLDHNVIERDDNGNTVLHLAAAAGSADLVAMIVALDGDVNAVNNHGETPLFAAMMSNRAAVVRQLLDLGTDASIRNRNGKTAAEIAELQNAFWNAVKNRSVATAQDLIRRGAEIDRECGRDTALSIACRQRDAAMVEMLLAAGAEVTDSTLSMEAMPKNFEPEIMVLLLKHVQDPNSVLRVLCSSVRRAPQNINFFRPNRNPFESLMTEENEIKFLYALLANPKTSFAAADHSGNRSLLALAIVARRSPAFISELLKHTGEFSADDPIMITAVLNEYPESILRELIAKKANVNVAHLDRTPLWVAKLKGRPGVTEFLLAHGADPDWRNSQGKTYRDVSPASPPAASSEVPAAPSEAPAASPEAPAASPEAPAAPRKRAAVREFSMPPPAAPAEAPRKRAAVREFSMPTEQAAVVVTLEERVRHVTARLEELRKAVPGKTESEAQREFREYRIKVREEQLKRLQAQQKVRERALALKKNPRQYPATQEFQEKFARYTREKRDWGYNNKDIRFAEELIAMLRSGRVDPNVEVIDSAYPRYSGPLIQAVLSGRIQRSKEIVEVLLRLGADVSPISASAARERRGFFRLSTAAASELILVNGGFDAMTGVLVPFCSRRPLNEKLVTDLLYLDHNVTGRDHWSNTALHLVAGAGSVKLVEMIVALDGDVNARNSSGETPLFAAMRNSRTAAARKLIELGADPSIRNRDGKTADEFEVQGRFWTAVRQRSVSAAEEYLKRGADINMLCDDGETALHISCKQRDVAMVAMLLKHGADPNLKERHARQASPLQLLITSKSFNAEIIELLLKHGADPNVPPPGWGGTTLLFNLCKRYSPLDENQQLKLLKLLLACPKTTRIDSRDNCSLLTRTLEHQRSTAFVLELLKDTDELDPKEPMLIYAISGNYPESVIRALIAKKANVNAVMNDKTPLWVAKEAGRSDVVKLLRNHGADAEWRNSSGQSIRELKPTVPQQGKRGRKSVR